MAKRNTAGLFDIRIIIALLLGLYGLVLTAMGLFTSSGQSTRTDGINANLWTGLALLVVSAAMGVWGKLRPIVIDEPAPGPQQDDEQAAPQPNR